MTKIWNKPYKPKYRNDAKGTKALLFLRTWWENEAQPLDVELSFIYTPIVDNLA